jgi:DNA-binding NtrC family response regulator
MTSSSRLLSPQHASPAQVVAQKRILVVDDEPTLRRIYSQIIQKAFPNAELVVAENSLDALAAYRKGRFDLVLSDNDMEQKGAGLALLRTLKSEDPNLRFILMSGAFDDSTINEANLNGVCATLSKPFEREVLISAITSALQATCQVESPMP